MPYIINLASNTALTAIENKKPSLSDLVKKTETEKKLLIIIMINVLPLKK